MVRVLVKADPDVILAAGSGKGVTAICAAESSANVAVVKLPSDLGADADANAGSITRCLTAMGQTKSSASGRHLFRS